MKIKKLLFLCFTFILMLTLSDTNAKYVALNFGDAFDIRFTKLTVFAENFVVRDTDWIKDGKEVDQVDSKNLWGALNGGNQSDYNLDDLENVSFSAINAMKNDRMLISFSIYLSLKNNTTTTLNITLTNTLTTNYNEQIKGSVSIVHNGNKADVSSSYFATRATGENYGNGPVSEFYINPIDYYNKVKASSTGNETWWKTLNTTEGVNEFEVKTLDNYFIMEPGQACEFNLKIELDGNANSAAIGKSFYTEVNMHATRYTGSY